VTAWVPEPTALGVYPTWHEAKLPEPDSKQVPAGEPAKVPEPFVVKLTVPPGIVGVGEVSVTVAVQVVAVSTVVDDGEH